MNRQVIAAVVTVVMVVFLCIVLIGGLGYNGSENWQVHQSVLGRMSIVDSPGYYLNWWGHVTTYPRYQEAFYSAHPKEGSKEDESIRATFNDGGTAQISSYVKVQLPLEKEQRLEFHRVFNANPKNVVTALRAHQVNCIKAAGPVMSASENQASRKAEFNKIVEDMMRDGLYEMQQHVVELKDLSLFEGQPPAEAKTNQSIRERPVEVMATRIVRDPASGKPVIASPSPLHRYGITIEQFSITDTDYDEKTREQFAAKKESFLLAEKAKAERQRAVQERLRIQAEGESEVEKIHQEGERDKMKAVVSAEKEADVAEIAKRQAVTVAQQSVEVAQQEQKEADTRRQIAEIEAQTAELKKTAEISIAQGRQKTLEIGGALSEERRVLAELKKNRDESVAKALSQIQTPRVVIVGGQEGNGGPSGEHSLQNNLMNLTLLKALGIFDDDEVFKTRVPRLSSTSDVGGTLSLAH